MSKRKNGVAILLVLVMSVGTAIAETSRPPLQGLADTAHISAPFYLRLHPAACVPVGDSGVIFGTGWGVSLVGGYRIPFLVPASLRVGMEYAYAPTIGLPTISLLSGTAGLGLGFVLGTVVGIEAHADVGYTYCFFNPPIIPEGYDNVLFGAGLDFRFFLSHSFSVDVGSSFLWQIGLYSGVEISLGATWELGGPAASPQVHPSPVIEQPDQKPAPLERKISESPIPQAREHEVLIEDIKLSAVFPVFFKYYDDHPVGTLRLLNGLDSAITDIMASVFIEDFMNAPQEMKPYLKALRLVKPSFLLLDIVLSF